MPKGTLMRLSAAAARLGISDLAARNYLTILGLPGRLHVATSQVEALEEWIELEARRYLKDTTPRRFASFQEAIQLRNEDVKPGWTKETGVPEKGRIREWGGSMLLKDAACRLQLSEKQMRELFFVPPWKGRERVAVGQVEAFERFVGTYADNAPRSYPRPPRSIFDPSPEDPLKSRPHRPCTMLLTEAARYLGMPQTMAAKLLTPLPLPGRKRIATSQLESLEKWISFHTMGEPWRRHQYRRSTVTIITGGVEVDE